MSRKKKKRIGEKPQSGHAEQPSEEDRVRAIFQWKPDEPVPPVDADTLRRYHEYLSARLSFPFAALCAEPAGGAWQKIYPVLVLRLLPVEETNAERGLQAEVAHDEEKRILPLCEIEMARDDPAASLIRDYIAWFEMARGEDDREPEPASVLRLVLHLGVYSAGTGASLGAILAVVEGAETAVTIGAPIVGVLGIMVGLWYGRLAALHRDPALRFAFFGMFGMILGVVVGALVGGLVAAFVGAIPGSIAGTLAGRWLVKRDPAAPFTWGIAGAFVGGLVLALYQDKDAALAGAGVGVLLGLGGGVVLLLFVVMALGLLFMSSK